MKLLIICFITVTITIESNYGKDIGKLKKLFEWCPENIEFVFKNQKLLKNLLATGKFIPKNNVPTGIAIHPYKKEMFMAIPRFMPGVLSTLNTVKIGHGKLNAPLSPYPCWEANDIYGKSKYPYKIISVIRTFVDSCGRLWVIDSGYDKKLTNRTQIEKPKLLIFDLKTDKLLRIHNFDASVANTKNSSLGKIVVDVTPKTCNKAFAYITDVMAPGLIVYNYAENIAYRIENNYLQLEPLKSSFLVEGKKIFAGVNIDSICLSGMYSDRHRNLYASPQLSNKQFITSTKFLRDKDYCSSKSSTLFHYLGERCSNCTPGAQVMDEKTGVMFYSDLNNNAISCWNGDHSKFGPLTQAQVAVSTELRYVSDLVLTKDRELAALSCDLRTFFYTNKGVTVRVFVGVVDSLIKGTVCQYHPKVSASACCQE